MLFKLSLRNIRKSIKDYSVYFFTLVLGVAIFYVFNALDSSTAMVELSNSTRDIVGLMMEMMGYISIFVCVVLGFLIIYANNFLMKRRKKEFGIYMHLGMGKRSISKILLLETLMIGSLSLLVGLILGVFASQFMSIIVANMFEADMKAYTFHISWDSILKTVLYFAIIYVVVMIFNTFSISKAKLIDLLNYGKVNEQIKVKKTWVSVVTFIFAICILSYAYYMVTGRSYTELMQLSDLGKAVLLGCIGTFLLFYSFSGFILKVVQSSKNYYLKNLNMFVLRQVNSKINTMVASMSIICIMLFFTICILSSAIVVNQATTAQLKKYTPVDLNISYFLDENSNPPEEKTIQTDLEKAGIELEEVFKDNLTIGIYTDPYLTIQQTLPSSVEQLGTIPLELKEELMKLSDYNKMAKLYHLDSISLKENEYAVVADFDRMVEYRNKDLKKKVPITLDGKTYYPAYNECLDGFKEITFNEMNGGFIVMNDEVLENKALKTMMFVGNYTDKYLEKEPDYSDVVIMNAIMEAHHSNEYPFGYGVMSKSYIYESSVGLSSIVTFIGIYLGIIFLIASAAVLALKELSESSDNKERYTILRKIGADEKMINHSLFIQIGIFFLLPLVVATIHSIFGIKFCLYILEIFSKSNLQYSIIFTAMFIAFIYGGYFLITYINSKRIIKE